VHRKRLKTAGGERAGVQTTLWALLNLDVPSERIARITTENRARLFGLAGKGVIAMGNDAGLALTPRMCRSWNARS